MGNSSTSFLDLCAILRAYPRSIRVRADDARSVGLMAIALREKKAGLNGVGPVHGIMGHHIIQVAPHYRDD
jgi:hypothetical protein